MIKKEPNRTFRQLSTYLLCIFIKYDNFVENNQHI